MGNTRTILHDPEIYRDPHEYTPDRFIKDGKLDHTVRDPSIAAFGFGRRICPGRFFGDNSLFVLVAHVLTVYHIRPTLDSVGNGIQFTPDVTGGVISHPLPFPCRIVPRSEAAVDLIHQSGFTE
ncbi:cytochrome P450-like protein [Macrolepiota fuliginosa MF-IS2]|uniref:Cytochrome P450-like protein n=1 Tax=Macrolepiota fuliginosa MF-IS2 TaxID=1400762 RepID=A0A9P6BZY9_9AGAR|nr:cytochrome P450-like protein [Macrolepiota fuliginosa MF-IS2]